MWLCTDGWILVQWRTPQENTNRRYTWGLPLLARAWQPAIVPSTTWKSTRIDWSVTNTSQLQSDHCPHGCNDRLSKQATNKHTSTSLSAATHTHFNFSSKIMSQESCLFALKSPFSLVTFKVFHAKMQFQFVYCRLTQSLKNVHRLHGFSQEWYIPSFAHKASS